MIRRKKRCVRCGIEQLCTEFSPAKAASDGLRSWCKTCSAAYSREMQANRRALIGDEAFRAEKRASVRRTRDRHGLESNRVYTRAKHRATQRLMASHPGEFAKLLAAERKRDAS